MKALSWVIKSLKDIKGIHSIGVDQAKVDAIEKMPCPKDIKGIRSFLGHAGFYRQVWGRCPGIVSSRYLFAIN